MVKNFFRKVGLGLQPTLNYLQIHLSAFTDYLYWVLALTARLRE